MRTSSLYNTGIDDLKETIKEIAINNINFSYINIVPNLRQKTVFENCLENVVSVCEGMKSGSAYETISIDLMEAIESLNQIIGNRIKPDVLNQIFSRFCIGK